MNGGTSPGIHDATLQEVRERFGSSEVRRKLFFGLVNACRLLKAAGCKEVFLDGSFVTEKPRPGDYDVCWDPTGVDTVKLNPVFLDFSDKRRKQKLKYGGEFFPSSARADSSLFFVDYFQKDKETGKKKGIIRLHLKELGGG